MKLLTVLLLLISSFCFGQNKQIQNVAASVSIERLQKNLFYLASDKLAGRVMGSHGDTLAAEFVARCFKDNNISAPYKNGKNYFQPITATRVDILQSELIIGNKKCEDLDGWTFTKQSAVTIHLNNIPVVFGGYGIENSRYNDFRDIDVKGKAVLLLRGQPKDKSGKYLLSGTNEPAKIPSPLTLLKEKGAVFILFYDQNFSADSSRIRKYQFGSVYKSPSNANGNLPSAMLSEDKVNELLSASKKTIRELEGDITQSGQPASLNLNTMVGIHIQVGLEKETAPNVIGVIKGTDATAGNVILCAHHDHVGRNGNSIYYGAVDNASGTVALMEIATLLNKAAQKGLKPKRTIVFASFTGEEKGLLGSYYFADNPLFPVEKTWAVLNIDMMGRVDTFYSGRRADSNYVYILVKDSLDRGLRTALYAANDNLARLHLDTYYEQPQNMQRRLLGSDQYPFYLKGTPFIRIDCGFSKDYHQPTDTPDKINYQLLSEQIQLAFLTLWNISNK